MSPRYDAVPDEPQLAPRRPISVPPSASPSPPAKPALVPMTVAVPSDVKQALKIACAVRGVKLQEAVEVALRTWLAQTDDKT